MRAIHLVTLLLFCIFTGAASATTKLVMLGTGTPVPDSERANTSTAVIYNNKAYLFDIGGGAVQNMIKAWQEKGIEALYPVNVSHLFITHLHSDHVLDYPVLAATYWWRRKFQLNVYGPVGIETMAQGYYQFLSADVGYRINGTQPIKQPTFYKTIQHEYKKGGWKVQDGAVTVEAFDVPHGEIKPAFGYKITTPDKTIVISGDTSKSQKVAEMARGVDILVHETVGELALKQRSADWQKYHAEYHTLTSELAEIANQAKPKLLVLSHVLYFSAPIESVLFEVQKNYSGIVILADDLDVFE